NAGKTADNFQGTVTIAQSKGRIGTTSSKWESDAYISLQPLSSGQTFPERQALLIKPWIAAENDFVRIGVTMPWMRWREPQALVGRHDSLTLGFVSEPLHIGEAKGIWNVARIHIGSATSPVDITTMMSELLNRTQRGLLVRLPLEQLNRTLVFPSLGNGDPKSSKLKQNYRYALEQVHGFMLGYPVSTNPSEPGQWIRGLSFGSQRWPDSLQLSPNNQTITTPYESSPYTNTANPMNSEVKEFFRSGEPKWLWDFALPQAYLMLFTAWYNTGKLQNWINGFAVAVGGTGEGNWHRDGPDYYNHGRTENTGLSDVYVLRPNPLMRDRFLQQGQSAIILFDKGQQLENTRGWVETVALHTGTDDDADSIAGDNFTQHLVALGDCAEFVPGPPGEACLAKMRELMGEIASDNLIDKMPCNGDEKPTGQCTVGSLFVYLYRYALFVWRFVHTFSADDGQVHRDAMVGLSKLLLDAFIPKKSALPDIEGIWSYYAKCDLASGSITSCNAIFGDPWQIYPDEKPQVLALPLIARQLADYAPDPCAYVRLLADDDALYSHWLEAYSSYYAGWIEGNSFFMQAMILAVGGLDECPN
ncbi:MAG: hypothetical protein KC609_16640, partial [Myxococcales bacterium]|nr:hypothetical protein [Myxococcales bacterium]